MQKFMKTSSKPSENNFSRKNEILIGNLASRLIEAQKSVDALLSQFTKTVPTCDAEGILENIFLRFHLVVQEICNRYDNRPPFFMDDEYDIRDTFDMIFCRNVLIYFERSTQENVIRKLTAKLKSGGIFFLGHSESITRMDVPLEQIMPTVFKKI